MRSAAADADALAAAADCNAESEFALALAAEATEAIDDFESAASALLRAVLCWLAVAAVAPIEGAGAFVAAEAEEAFDAAGESPAFASAEFERACESESAACAGGCGRRLLQSV